MRCEQRSTWSFEKTKPWSAGSHGIPWCLWSSRLRRVVHAPLSDWLLGLLAVLALLLSTIGIYGVISYATVQRTHEVGIRMVLGAESTSILSMILRQGFAL